MPETARVDVPLDRPVYSIGAVARMVGVATATLRSWEDRYGLVAAERSEGGQRLYTRDQVERLRFVKSRVDQGHRAGEAHRLLEEHLAGADVPLVEVSEPAHGLLILLAERDRFAAELSEYFLRTEGYTIEVVLDHDAVLASFEQNKPDLVLLELLIAGGWGRDLVRELSDRGARVLALSPLQLADDALGSGAEAFLRKPFDPLQLVSAVRDLLGTSALLRELP